MLPPHSMLRMGSDLKMKPEVWQAKEWTNNNLEHSPGPDQKAAKNVLAEIALKKRQIVLGQQGKQSNFI